MNGQENFPSIWLRRQLSRYQIHRQRFSLCYEFIVDVVSCVLRYRVDGAPSSLQIRPSGFSSTIGQALLDIITNMEIFDPEVNDGTHPLDEVLGVIAECHERWDVETKTRKIGQFLCGKSDLLTSHDPFDYFSYFAYLCLLCEKFTEVDRPDCVQTATEFTFILFFILSNNFQNFHALELCAEEYLHLFL